jgi:hypothetical protein
VSSQTREDVFMTRIENNEVVHGLREACLDKIGPYNENIKLVLAPSRLNNNDNRTANPVQELAAQNGSSKSFNVTHTNNSSLSTSSKRGSKRKTSESSTGPGAYNSYTTGSSGSFGSNKRRGMNDYSKLEKMVS